MIVRVNKGILHILDGNSGFSVMSDRELDVEDASIGSYIANQIEKNYGDPGLKTGVFNDNSGLRYHLKEYLKGELDFCKLSVFAAENLYDSIVHSDKIDSSDLIICDCEVDERPVFAVLKCDNTSGYVHHVVQGDGVIKNEIINHYAILPKAGQKIAECAFVDLEDFSIKFSGKKRKIDGETVDLMADVLLECLFDISTKESFSKMEKIAAKISDDYSRDPIEAKVKLKQHVIDNISAGEEELQSEAFADAIFDGAPAMKAEFNEKIRDIGVPEKIEINEFVSKRASSKIKIKTDTGIEISFPAEYYKDSEYFEIINNEDGTLSVKLNNIGEIIG